MGLDSTFYDDVIAAMKGVFGDDQRRIDHAMAVLDYAEQIGASIDADSVVVSAAAILHDIGIKKSEELYGSSSAKYQEIEGPPVAREILERLELSPEKIDHVCGIIANHHTAKDAEVVETDEFKAIWDGDWLVNLCDVFPDAGKSKLERIVDEKFRTEKGRQLAKKIYAL
ncbi:MAG: HD domain-containing protein [Planctomycetes bacterium]|nr:HD domain-containing protein [Planctomycetota bacterium]